MVPLWAVSGNFDILAENGLSMKLLLYLLDKALNLLTFYLELLGSDYIF